MQTELTQNEQNQISALVKAKSNTSTANYHSIIEGFTAKGVEVSEIIPRENVFTFSAWRALGRVVRRGEKGVKVITWVEKKDVNGNVIGKYPKETTVFHVSQTIELH